MRFGPALKVGAVLTGVIGAGAALAFGAGFFVSQVRGGIEGAFERGYIAGGNAHAVLDAIAAQDAADAANRAEREREAETARAIAAERTRATDAEKALAALIARERKTNAKLDQCLALPYPDHLRAHVPDGVLLSPEAASSRDDSGRSREVLAPVSPDGLRG